jgi:hypothetical protein
MIFISVYDYNNIFLPIQNLTAFYYLKCELNDHRLTLTIKLHHFLFFGIFEF